MGEATLFGPLHALWEGADPLVVRSGPVAEAGSEEFHLGTWALTGHGQGSRRMRRSTSTERDRSVARRLPSRSRRGLSLDWAAPHRLASVTPARRTSLGRPGSDR